MRLEKSPLSLAVNHMLVTSVANELSSADTSTHRVSPSRPVATVGGAARRRRSPLETTQKVKADRDTAPDSLAARPLRAHDGSHPKFSRQNLRFQ